MKPHSALVGLAPGTVVAVLIECPRFLCWRRWEGSAEVVNEYGVRQIRPKVCKCGITGRVLEIGEVLT